MKSILSTLHQTSILVIYIHMLCYIALRTILVFVLKIISWKPLNSESILNIQSTVHFCMHITVSELVWCRPIIQCVTCPFLLPLPGYWFMHCHVEFHNAEGMGLVMKAGNESQMNAKPRSMRSCSDFRYPEENTLNSKQDINMVLENDLFIQKN